MAFTSIVEMARMTRKSRHAVGDNHLAALGKIVDGYYRTAEKKNTRCRCRRHKYVALRYCADSCRETSL